MTQLTRKLLLLTVAGALSLGFTACQGEEEEGAAGVEDTIGGEEAEQEGLFGDEVPGTDAPGEEGADGFAELDDEGLAGEELLEEEELVEDTDELVDEPLEEAP